MEEARKESLGEDLEESRSHGTFTWTSGFQTKGNVPVAVSHLLAHNLSGALRN